MKRTTRTTKFFFVVLSLFIPGCILMSPTTSVDPATAAGGTVMPTFEEAATAVLSPTIAPTEIVYPPVYVPKSLGDSRELDSFSMIMTFNRIENGTVAVDLKDGLDYIREPFRMHWLQGSLYVIDDHIYERINGGKGWQYQIGPYQGDVLDWQAVQTPDALISDLQSAQFIGQEDFNGLPANHFTFTEKNFREMAGPQPGEWGSTQGKAEGDFYLSQNGNYLLYFHIINNKTLYEPDGTHYASVQENTYELTRINQSVEIALPADFDLEIDFGLPLPAGTTLNTIISYRDGFSPDSYYYSLPARYDEFLEFYKNLAPTNGITFSRIGTVPNNIACDSEDCVMLKKGNIEILLHHSSDTNSNFLSAQVYR